MSEYTLSVVQLCPDAYKDAANAIAEAAGYGTGNLSVELRDASGGIWWGCHSPWIPSALERATNLPSEAPAEWHAALEAVKTSAIPREDYFQHWVETLAANALTVYAPEEV
ncbi:hypothetical protein D3C87_1797130 [compost metagenome]